MLKNKNTLRAFTVLILAVFGLTQCTKPEKGDDFPKGDPPPVAGGYVNSSEVSPANLVAHFTFDGTVADAKGAVTGGVASGTTSFVVGRKGQAYQGSESGFIAYANPGPLATLTSFTVALWINTDKHPVDAQGVFGLAKQDGSLWGNFFMLIESNNTSSNRMFMKLHFEKNYAPFVEHWIEPHGFGAIDYRPDDMYNAWRHVAWTYDAVTSKAAFFVSGQKKDLPPGAEDRKADGAGTPLGTLNFKDATKFVIGGWQNNLGAPFNSPESWMRNYKGKLDEFRIYNKALTAQEISAIAVLERQGR